VFGRRELRVFWMEAKSFDVMVLLASKKMFDPSLIVIIIIDESSPSMERDVVPSQDVKRMGLETEEEE